jgi:hypothetical protein
MTEAEWFASVDALAMIAQLGPDRSDRKLRLLACQCLRALGEELPFRSHECVKYVEKYVDGLLSRSDAFNRVMRRALEPDVPLLRWVPIHLIAPSAHEGAAEVVFWVCGRHHPEVTHDWQLFAQTQSPRQPHDSIIDIESHAFAPLLRDIFGNPFRPARFRPSWRTGTATAIARQMYESRDFGAMPILADALQDAGCDCDDLLAHCRDPQGVHVRGCWAVDLVLGKS